jgi:hypothetical protein
MEPSRRFPGNWRALFEAAKLAPRQRHELALAYGKGQRGNGNRATLAVAGKMSERGLALEH